MTMPQAACQSRGDLGPTHVQYHGFALPWYHDPRGCTMTITDEDSVGATLSVARLGPYLAQHAGDLEAAWRTYSWNIQACQAFYPLLHFAEIALRNAVHRE